MAVNNPWTITYSSDVSNPGTAEKIGGASDVYLIDGPYTLSKSFEAITVGFDVIVAASSYNDDTASGLQQLSAALEVAFRGRDKSLKIDIDGTAWTYTHGTDILNTISTIVKSGDPETDRGVSRRYSVEIAGGLPADDNTGLQDFAYSVDYTPSRQKTVSFTGVYTPFSTATASEQYAADFDAEAAIILLAIGGTSTTFELIAEQFEPDRNDHTCTFARTYVELLADQSEGVLDDPDIRNHNMTFTNLMTHPGDGQAGVQRLQRVVGTYDCGIDIDVTTDMQSVYQNKVRPHVLALFQLNFEPALFAVESSRVSYDETSKQMSVEIQFTFQPSGGSAIIEATQTLAYRESRTIDYTPVHLGDELAFEADPGWAVVERVATRQVTALGSQSPKRRLGGKSASMPGIEGGAKVSKSGWNIISNNSQVESRWIGDPSDAQLQISVLTEAVVERFSKRATGSA